MCDFDLSQAVESSPGFDETGCERSFFDTTDAQDEIIKLDVGLDLVVSRNPKTMQGVATLLLAVNRMKKPLMTCRSQQLDDDELCSVIMGSVVDETIFKTVDNLCTEGEKKIFQRLSSLECTLCDTSKKDIILSSADLKLQAVTLRAGNGNHRVTFKLVKYVTPSVSAAGGQTVVLSITKHNLYISCNMKGDNAELKLEECSKEDLRRISNDGDMDRFLFYSRDTGINVTTFESVKYRGWFISTSYERENQPLEMCHVDTAQRVTSFKIN